MNFIEEQPVSLPADEEYFVIRFWNADFKSRGLMDVIATQKILDLSPKSKNVYVQVGCKETEYYFE